MKRCSREKWLTKSQQDKADARHRWTKHQRNPILTPIPGSPYESIYNSSQSVIRDGDHYKMYYATRIDMIHKYYSICMARKPGKILAT